MQYVYLILEEALILEEVLISEEAFILKEALLSDEALILDFLISPIHRNICPALHPYPCENGLYPFFHW